MTWTKTKVGNFLFERAGRFDPKDKKIQGLKRIEKIDFKGNFYIGNKASNTDMILIKKGDLVISGINVAKGAIGIYTEEEDVVATIHYSSYTFDKSKINLDFFKMFLKSSKFVKLINEQVRGGIKTEIKPKHILPLEINLPNIEAQNTIVSNFEKIKNDLHFLANEVDNQNRLINLLKQSILQEAVEGKLTSQWRKHNQDTQSASNLLKKIQAEKKYLVEEGKIKKIKPLKEINKDEIPFEIPESWEWCKFGEIIYEKPRNGYSPKAVNFETNVKTLKLGAVTYGSFDKTQFKYINEDIEDDSYLWLKDGDILIQRSNSIDYVGMSCIYNGNDNEFIYPDLIMKSRVVDSISNNYIQKVLVSKFNRDYYKNNATGAQKTMPKINQGVVINTLIPVPPSNEQVEILKKLDNLFAICDELEEQINCSKQNAQFLVQSVIDETFIAA